MIKAVSCVSFFVLIGAPVEVIGEDAFLEVEVFIVFELFVGHLERKDAVEGEGEEQCCGLGELHKAVPPSIEELDEVQVEHHRRSGGFCAVAAGIASSIPIRPPLMWSLGQFVSVLRYFCQSVARGPLLQMSPEGLTVPHHPSDRGCGTTTTAGMRSSKDQRATLWLKYRIK